MEHSNNFRIYPLSQQHMEHSPRLIIWETTKKVSINFLNWNYNIYSNYNTIRLEINNKIFENLWCLILVVHVAILRDAKQTCKTYFKVYLWRCFQRRLACGTMNWVEKTCPECGQHHPIDWGPRCNEKVERKSYLLPHSQPFQESCFSCCFYLWTIHLQVLQTLNTNLHQWLHRRLPGL